VIAPRNSPPLRDLAASDVGGFTERATLPRVFTVLGDGRYKLLLPTLRLEFEIDRLHYERNELMGDLIVRADWAGAPTFDGVLSSGRFNLDAVHGRKQRADLLRRRPNCGRTTRSISQRCSTSCASAWRPPNAPVGRQSS
jgi:hypothetical protein